MICYKFMILVTVFGYPHRSLNVNKKTIVISENNMNNFLWGIFRMISGSIKIELIPSYQFLCRLNSYTNLLKSSEDLKNKLYITM